MSFSRGEWQVLSFQRKPYGTYSGDGDGGIGGFDGRTDKPVPSERRRRHGLVYVLGLHFEIHFVLFVVFEGDRKQKGGTTKEQRVLNGE